MSTTLLNKDTVTRKWYVLDAAGKPMGKTAALAADLLRGKLKTDYTPHVDCGDFVIIINAEQAVLTGKKLEQKYYRTHSGYPGYASGCARHAAEEHHRPVAAQAPEDLSRRRASPCGTEARSLGSLRRRK